ncbi:hypothetical protein MHH93_23895 [Priestia sp. FSL H7-0729]
MDAEAGSSEGDGIDSEEAELKAFCKKATSEAYTLVCLGNSPFGKGNQGNLETTAIIRTIRTRSGHPSAKSIPPRTQRNAI